jgi:hypothetical protein
MAFAGSEYAGSPAERSSPKASGDTLERLRGTASTAATGRALNSARTSRISRHAQKSRLPVGGRLSRGVQELSAKCRPAAMPWLLPGTMHNGKDKPQGIHDKAVHRPRGLTPWAFLLPGHEGSFLRRNRGYAVRPPDHPSDDSTGHGRGEGHNLEVCSPIHPPVQFRLIPVAEARSQRASAI